MSLPGATGELQPAGYAAVAGVSLLVIRNMQERGHLLLGALMLGMPWPVCWWNVYGTLSIGRMSCVGDGAMVARRSTE